VFSRTTSPEAAPDRVTRIRIDFKDGLPRRVENLDDGSIEEAPLPLFEYLNRLGSENGIGRLDLVENRFVGVKSRGIHRATRRAPGDGRRHTVGRCFWCASTNACR